MPNIVYATPKQIKSGVMGTSNTIVLSDTLIVTLYGYDVGGGTYTLYAKAGGVSGNDITWAAEASVTNPIADSRSYYDCKKINATQFLVVYANGARFGAKVGTVAGDNTISFGGETSLWAPTMTSSNSPKIKLVKGDTTPFVACIQWRDYPGSYYGYIIAMTVSDTTVSAGSITNVGGSGGNECYPSCDCFDTANNKYGLLYPYGDSKRTRVMTIDGTAITLGDATEVWNTSSQEVGIVLGLTSTTYAVFKPGTSTFYYYVVTCSSGTTISIGGSQYISSATTRNKGAILNYGYLNKANELLLFLGAEHGNEYYVTSVYGSVIKASIANGTLAVVYEVEAGSDTYFLNGCAFTEKKFLATTGWSYYNGSSSTPCNYVSIGSMPDAAQAGFLFLTI